jgi:hypothetical protein
MLLPSQTITKSTENSTTYSTSNRVMAWQHKSFSFPTASQNDVWRSSTCTFPLFQYSVADNHSKPDAVAWWRLESPPDAKDFAVFFREQDDDDDDDNEQGTDWLQRH